MNELLQAVRCGRVSFALFERRTRPIWRNMAESLLRRWKGPIAVSVDDVVQELLLGVWIFVAHWEPHRRDSQGHPITLERFVVFNSMDKAKKWLHQQRNAYRRDDKSPSRIERCFSSYGGRSSDDYDPEQALLDRVAEAPVAEEAIIERETARIHVLEALARTPSEHLPAMAAIARTGDIDLAAQYLAAQPVAFVLGYDTPNDAHRAVVRALKSVAAA